MKKKIESIIAKLEQIPVSGMGAILMGDSLKELFLLKEIAPEEKQEEDEDAVH